MNKTRASNVCINNRRDEARLTSFTQTFIIYFITNLIEATGWEIEQIFQDKSSQLMIGLRHIQQSTQNLRHDVEADMLLQKPKQQMLADLLCTEIVDKIITQTLINQGRPPNNQADRDFVRNNPNYTLFVKDIRCYIRTASDRFLTKTIRPMHKAWAYNNQSGMYYTIAVDTVLSTKLS